MLVSFSNRLRQPKIEIWGDSVKTVLTYKGMLWIVIITLCGVINIDLDCGSGNASKAWADTASIDSENQEKPQISSLSSDFIDYSNQQRSKKSSTATKKAIENVHTGYIHSPLSAEKHKPESGTWLKVLSRQTINESLYDMRDPNNDGNRADSLLAPVKEQYAGNCWAYATYGSLESQLKQYYGIDQDFSVDKLTTHNGFDWSGYNGGNMDMSAAYLTRHDGPTSDNEDDPLRYVDNIIFLPVRSSVHDNSYIKEAIKKYGGLYTVFQWSDSSYDASNYAYFYDDPDDSFNDVNHAVVIVGWDDQKMVPGAPGTGAFIVRNSWGELWGEDGYFYVSYFDESLAFIRLVGFDDTAESSFEFDEVHLYDELGCQSSLGYGSTAAWGANRFLPDKDGFIKAISFYALRSNMTYEIKIYDEFNGVSFYNQLLSQEGALNYGGWHTIILDQEVPIQLGDDYTVVIKFATSDYNYPVPIETPIQNYSSGATANPGESFISGDGNNWSDVTNYYSNTNICIKAFVSDQATTPSEFEVKHYFPQIACEHPWETEICLINTSAAQSLNGLLKAYDSKGQQVDLTQTVHLSPKARKEITVANEFSNADTIRYIVFESDIDTLVGYTKIFSQGRYRVAVPIASGNAAQSIHVPHIASNENWWTELSLLNTTSERKSISIEFNTGQTITRSINAYEQQSFCIKDLFNNISQPDIQSAIIKNVEGIVGMELFGSTDSCSDNYLGGILLNSDTATDLYYPHVAHNAQWWTGVVAYNPNDTTCTFSVTTYDQDGTILSFENRDLQAHEKFIGTPTSLEFPVETAWFSIHADSPITGFELFGTTDGQQLGGYTGVNIQKQEGVFTKIDDEGWTGIAFINTQPETAAITIKAYNDSGNLIASGSLTLDTYEKMVGLSEKLFSQNISAATYITFTSDMNVVGFQLNGSSDDMMLDALSGM